MIEGLVRTRVETPPDAVIWTTWSFGYIIIYCSERATVSDGQAHPDAKKRLMVKNLINRYEIGSADKPKAGSDDSTAIYG